MAIAQVAGFIKNKMLYLSDRRLFDYDISRSKDRPVLLTVEEEKYDQSDEQRGYYHSTVKHHMFRCLRENGYEEIKTVQDAHWLMKMMFLKRREFVDKMTGEKLEKEGSTAILSKDEYRVFLDNVISLAAKMGYTIPPPEKIRSKRQKGSVILASYDPETQSTIVKKAS